VPLSLKMDGYKLLLALGIFLCDGFLVEQKAGDVEKIAQLLETLPTHHLLRVKEKAAQLIQTKKDERDAEMIVQLLETLPANQLFQVKEKAAQLLQTKSGSGCFTTATYNGNDIDYEAGIGSAADCQAICVKQSSCKYFTYATAGPTAGGCWLKSAKNPQQAQAGYKVLSGPKVCCFTTLTYNGNDISYQSGIGGVEDCQALCVQNNKCNYFTYALDGGTNAGGCWLKSAKNPQPAPAGYSVISGPKVCEYP